MNDSFIWQRNGEVMFGFFPPLAETGRITHGLSTRMGGVSTGCYRSMNLAYNSDDDPKNVRKNYEIFTSSLGVKLQNAVLSHQTHHTNVRKVLAADRGKGFTVGRDYESVDGLITNVVDTPLMTFHADCLPLMFVDPVGKSIGLAHAGWKGTVHNLAGKMVDNMVHYYGTNPSNILVGIGPSIRECCFIIRDDVRQAFLKELPFTEKFIEVVGMNQWKISLQNVTMELLKKSGIKNKNIIDAGICTCCRSDLLFSHRALGNNRGTMAAVLQLNEK